MNAETARALLAAARQQEETARRLLDRSQYQLAHAQRTWETARDHYNASVGLVSERERLVREMVIAENGGQHP